MTIEDIQKLRDLGEASKVQFKESISEKYDMGYELIAMSDARRGQFVIGINDKTGAFNPLLCAEVQETINLLSNIASENVMPNILLEIGTVNVECGSVVLATIKEGNNKFYHVTTNKWSDDLSISLDDSDTTPNTFLVHSDATPNTSSDCPNTFSEHMDTTPNTFSENPNTKRIKLSNKQKDIVNFCSIPRSSREILERAGVKYHNSNIQRYVTELVEAGYLERTIPNSPFDPNQKYRKKQSL